jgi:two-component system, OmpR family, sensor kinase
MRRHHHRKHRHFKSRRWRHRASRWLLAKGIHRRVVAFLLVAAAMGAAGGWMAHVHSASGLGLSSALCWAVALFGGVWPLAWVATFRIARPVAELARVAGAIGEGELSRREGLPVDSDDEVGEVAGALKAVADRVSQQLDDQRSLMAAVSHELRSPLGRLRVMVELAREGNAPNNLHDELQAEIDGMDALIGDLLAAARIDFDAVTLRDLDARTVALRALEIAGLPADTLREEGDLGRLRADATLLSRAIAVLLDNAVKHGGPQRTLWLTDQGNALRMEVRDDGCGFAEGEEEMVFQPFWRKPPEAGVASDGVGLGLHLVRQIARAHGGSAGARDLNPGAAVWIELPRALPSD